MFKNLKVEKNVSYSTVVVTETGNPFSVKAILGEEDGQFKGASFIEVYKKGKLVANAGIFCGPCGVVHSLEGDADAESLTAICQKLNTSIEEAYDMKFETAAEPMEMEEPQPPTEAAGESEETED